MENVRKFINEEIENLKEDIIASTVELIKIKSVESTAQDGMPFGKGVNDALVFAKTFVKNLSLRQKILMGMHSRQGLENIVKMCA